MKFSTPLMIDTFTMTMAMDVATEIHNKNEKSLTNTQFCAYMYIKSKLAPVNIFESKSRDFIDDMDQYEFYCELSTFFDGLAFCDDMSRKSRKENFEKFKNAVDMAKKIWREENIK